MDEIIRRTNIDSDAIIVITGSRMTSIGRAYFNFRYWGFPRQQLKVLNGTSATYAAAGFALQTEDPPVPGALSIQCVQHQGPFLLFCREGLVCGDACGGRRQDSGNHHY